MKHYQCLVVKLLIVVVMILGQLPGYAGNLNKIIILSLQWDPTSEDIVSTVYETITNNGLSSKIQVEVIDAEQDTELSKVKKYNANASQAPGVILLDNTGKILSQRRFNYDEMDSLAQLIEGSL